MHLQPLRRASALVTAGVAAAILSACGGHSWNPVVPGATNAPSPKTVTHKTIVITKASIPSVMAKLIRASAFASPMKGHPRQPQSLRRALTSSAGMDLSYNGGPVQTGASEYNVLVNCNDESCWGGLIGQFENDLFSSNMIHIVDQYNAGGTYGNGGDYGAQYDTSQQLSDQDIYNILYNVITASNLPTGYGSEFHIFLGSGVQQCSQAAGGCYAQQYCAYHGSNDWSDIGHVLYSVEPYQDIQGCSVGGGSPNGSLADSTASTLSHEMFETITDPDVAAGNVAWYNQQGGEIGDLCAPAAGVPTQVVQLGSDSWQIQSEYSNTAHDCSYSP